MKSVLAAIAVFSLAGCSPAAQVSQQRMLILPCEQFRVGGVTSDLAGALGRLGPPGTTQVNLTDCSNVPFATVQRVKEAVEKAGYSRIGFAVAEGHDRDLCQTERQQFIQVEVASRFDLIPVLEPVMPCPNMASASLPTEQE